MSSIHVSPQEMINTSGRVDSKIVEWNAAVSRIYQLAGEMDAMWDGLGNDSFNVVFNNDRPKFDSLNILMTDYSKAIKTAAELYNMGEQEIKKIVTRK